MKAFLAFVSAVAVSVTATYDRFHLDYSPAEAYQYSEWQKYHCMTTDKLVSELPSCISGCQYKCSWALACPTLYDASPSLDELHTRPRRHADIAPRAAQADHLCREDDYVCHCLLAEVSGYDKVIAPCAQAACSPDDLAIVNATVADMCNFFQATLYASYTGCPQVQLDYGIAGLITTFALKKRDTVIEGA